MSAPVSRNATIHLAPELFVTPTVLTPAEMDALKSAPLVAQVKISYGIKMPALQIGPWRLTYWNWTVNHGWVESSSYENETLRLLNGSQAKELFCKALSLLPADSEVVRLAREDGVEPVRW